MSCEFCCKLKVKFHCLGSIRKNKETALRIYFSVYILNFIFYVKCIPFSSEKTIGQKKKKKKKTKKKGIHHLHGLKAAKKAKWLKKRNYK